jgi:hypothetical protein
MIFAELLIPLNLLVSDCTSGSTSSEATHTHTHTHTSQEGFQLRLCVHRDVEASSLSLTASGNGRVQLELETTPTRDQIHFVDDQGIRKRDLLDTLVLNSLELDLVKVSRRNVLGVNKRHDPIQSKQPTHVGVHEERLRNCQWRWVSQPSRFYDLGSELVRHWPQELSESVSTWKLPQPKAAQLQVQVELQV